jgi:hypothetical protein
MVRGAGLALVVVVAACESSDKIPPKGATMTVAANPATIPLAAAPECVSLLGVPNCGTADIVATVASELGLPLPDQDVRFSSTAGFLFTGSITSPVDAANIPIRTDKFGNAAVNLITSTTATVTAKSGPASGTLTISAVSGNLSAILLNLDTTSTGCTSSSLTVQSCSQKICFVATAVDPTGKGIQGVVIEFKLQNNVSSDNKEFKGTFNPTSDTTVPGGNVTTEFTPDSGTCPAQCSTSQNGGKTCTAQVIATTQGGTFQSSPLTLTINIP